MSCVYGLFDPRVGRVRYVGKTSMKPHLRLSAHISQARRVRKPTGLRLPVNLWMAKLLDEGVQPAMRILEECESGSEGVLEQDWIANLREAWPLLNCTDGGDGGRWSPTARAKMSARMKAKWRDTDFGQTRAKPATHWTQTEEGRRAVSERSKKSWTDPSYRAKVLANRVPPPLAAACPHGHPYDEANTGWGTIRKNGAEHVAHWCRACKRQKSREKRQRAKGES